MELTLQRKEQHGDAIIGYLFDTQGRFLCYILEDVKDMIPGGRYKISTDIVSPKYKARGEKSQYAYIGFKLPRLTHKWNDSSKTWEEIYKATGRQGILIHIGNYTTDTEGCLLTGANYTIGKDYISNSTAAFNMLYPKLTAESDRNVIEIKDIV